MLTPETIADILPLNLREIYRQVEAGKVHFMDIDERRIVVCVKSLTQTSANIEQEEKKLWRL